MKNHVMRISLSLCAFSLLFFNIQAQQPSDEAQIKQKRLAIRVMSENAPASDAPDSPNHRRRLAQLRHELLRLLIKKTGSLETKIQNLQVAEAESLVREQIGQFKNELKSVEDEIRALDQILGQVEVPSTPRPPQPTEPASAEKEEAEGETNEVSPNRKAERKLFDDTVARTTPEALEAAALPAEINSTPPACNEKGRPAVIPYSRLDEALCRLGSDLAKNNRTIDLENDQANIMTILIAKLLKTKTNGGESYSSFVTSAQELRTDQQMGAGPTSNVSTSLVSKGGIPYLFGLAVENGAAEQTQKDTAITFRFNPGGVINMFADKGFITGFQATDNDPVLKFLRKTSVGLTFDTSRGDIPGTFTGSRQQLSQVQARIEFVNERDPRHKRYLADWEQLVANEGVRLAQQQWKTTVALTDWTGEGDITFKDPVLQAWLLKTQERIGHVEPGLDGVAKINAIAKVISEQADQLPINMVPQEMVDEIAQFAAENEMYVEKKNELFDKIARGKVFTIEYTNKREVNAADTSNFNFIAATGAGGPIDLTANGSFTFFNSRPVTTSLTSPRPGRVRDFQFAGQIDVPFKLRDIGQFDFWFSGRYERLLEDATSVAGTTIPNTKGDIAVGQFGFNIPIPSLGIKFPISVTFANRTELIKEKEIRGNFGFTFNWDTLFSKIKPF